ncbi:MAG: PadR family transcriptional regulator [Bryobacteraceae bacterium]|nr:PadR family transcriptional regulator [Bryobacteraceae bacterium]
MSKFDALQGSLPLLVLKIVERRGPLHGYAITTHIEGFSELLRVEEGSLYPALHRLEEAGLIRAEWSETQHKRRVRMYSITAAGRRRLREDERRWTAVSAAIGQVLREA